MSMFDVADDDLDEEPSLERGTGYSNVNLSNSSCSSPLRRSHFARQLRRTVPRSNSLLHVRHLAIQRRKPSILSRVLQGRTLQSQLRSASNPAHSTSSLSQTSREEASRRLADQVIETV